MGLLQWLTRNWADTDEPDGDLEPLLLQQDQAQALIHVQQAIKYLTRWQIEAVDEANGTIHATRRTKLFRFVDDIHIRLEPMGNSTRIHARSQSRVGIGDLGQNRRNLLELGEVLQLLNCLGQIRASTAALGELTKDLNRLSESGDLWKDKE